MDKKELLRLEIEDTQVNFHDLLDRIPETAYSLPSQNSAWTVGEVLYHMSLAPRFLISDVRMFTSQQWIYKLLPVLMPGRLFNWLNKVLTRYGAGRLDRQFLADEYDRAHKSTLKSLEMVREENLQQIRTYPDWDPLLSGEVSLERLFHYIKVHFNSHAGQLQSILEEKEA